LFLFHQGKRKTKHGLLPQTVSIRAVESITVWYLSTRLFVTFFVLKQRKEPKKIQERNDNSPFLSLALIKLQYYCVCSSGFHAYLFSSVFNAQTYFIAALLCLGERCFSNGLRKRALRNLLNAALSRENERLCSKAIY